MDAVRCVITPDFARDVLSASERRSLDPYGLGHGIGVTPEESPVLAADSQAMMESGMCLVVRAVLTGDRGLVVHGDTIVV
jgi:Xaa-Pro aminopeptidase